MLESVVLNDDDDSDDEDDEGEDPDYYRSKLKAYKQKNKVASRVMEVIQNKNAGMTKAVAVFRDETERLTKEKKEEEFKQRETITALEIEKKEMELKHAHEREQRTKERFR